MNKDYETAAVVLDKIFEVLNNSGRSIHDVAKIEISPNVEEFDLGVRPQLNEEAILNKLKSYSAKITIRLDDGIMIYAGAPFPNKEGTYFEVYESKNFERDGRLKAGVQPRPESDSEPGGEDFSNDMSIEKPDGANWRRYVDVVAEKITEEGQSPEDVVWIDVCVNNDDKYRSFESWADFAARYSGTYIDYDEKESGDACPCSVVNFKDGSAFNFWIPYHNSFVKHEAAEQ